MDKRERNTEAILGILRDSQRPLSSRRIRDQLRGIGLDLSERSVRVYLRETDAAGLTEAHGRRGRTITRAGLDDLHGSETLKRLGTLSAKIDQLTYRMDFDLARRTGQVVVNVALVKPADLLVCVDEVCQVFARGLAMGELTTLLEPGERLGPVVVPEGLLGFCTVCSITLNGVFLKHAIPTSSRFGGLLQLRPDQPARFVEMITYDGTSVDPLAVFIRSGMTDYRGAISSGAGRVGASFREVPADSRSVVGRLGEQLAGIGLGGIWQLGLPNQPLLDIPVSDGRIGMVVIGGLNPVAILEETGRRVQAWALAGLLDFHRLFRYDQLPARLAKLG